MIIAVMNAIEANMHEKKIPAHDHRPKKNLRMYSWLEKNSGKILPVLTQ